MPVTNPTPVVAPAVPQQTYNLLWVNMSIQGLGNTGVRAMITLTPYYLDSNNNPVYATTGIKNILVKDLLSAAATDSVLASNLNSIFTEVESWLTTLPAYAQLISR